MQSSLQIALHEFPNLPISVFNTERVQNGVSNAGS